MLKCRGCGLVFKYKAPWYLLCGRCEGTWRLLYPERFDTFRVSCTWDLRPHEEAPGRFARTWQTVIEVPDTKPVTIAYHVAKEKERVGSGVLPLPVEPGKVVLLGMEVLRDLP